jgi:predicted RNA binding protein YcfA (HicA-like mRNA interferase family)
VKQVNAKTLARAITRKGWKQVRVRGSHHIFTKQGRSERIVIPMHGASPLKTGLLRTLMKIADIQEDDL